MADAGVMRGVVLRALGASWGDLGSSWAPLGSRWESFWALLGHLLGLRGRVGSGKDAKVKIQITLRAYPPTLQQHLHSLALLCLAYLGGCFCPNMFLFVVRPQAAKGREQSSPAPPARSA